MLCILFFIASYVSLIDAITLVPGTIHVRLLSENQIMNRTYLPGTSVHYFVQLENVPVADNVYIGVEIRGSNPLGGPRGYIQTARVEGPVKKFLRETYDGLRFELLPVDVYAGYYWFFRPYVYYADEPLVSTNMMNAAASEMFHVLKK